MLFKTACIQINSGNDLQLNINSACDLIKQATNAGADIVSTPECVVFMAGNSDELCKNSFLPDVHPALLQFQELTAKLKIHLIIGSLAIKTNHHDTKLYNRSFVINPEGQIICEYDKIHLYDADLPNGKRYKESDSYLAGGQCKTANLPWGKLGMSICYDVRFPHLYRHLSHDGADFLSIPAAFVNYTGKAHWEVLLRARAIENGCYVFAPAQTGRHPANRNTYGHSMIINPWGEILTDAGTDEGFIIAQIDTDLIASTRASLASLKHDKEFI